MGHFSATMTVDEREVAETCQDGQPAIPRHTEAVHFPEAGTAPTLLHH